MDDSLLEFSFRLGKKTKFFYKNKNAALSASWCGNENTPFPEPSEITLFVSDGDIEIDDNGRIASLSYSMIPVTYVIHRDDISFGSREIDDKMIPEIVGALKEARTFIREKETEVNAARTQRF